MHRPYDLSSALASYRAYYEQPPSEQRLSDFIAVLDSLYPRRSSQSADNLLLLQLIMIDPNLFTPTNANANAQGGGENLNHWNAILADKELLRLAMSMSPESLHLNSPAFAAQFLAARAAVGTPSTHPAEQPSQGISFGNALNVESKPPVNTAANSYDYNYDYDTSNNAQIPAPQFVKQEGTQFSGRPYPRMRPPPPPSPTGPSGLQAPYTPVQGHSVTTPSTADKGRVAVVGPSTPASGSMSNVKVPSPHRAGPFVGHAMMRFKGSKSSTSGLRINPAPPPFSSAPPSYMTQLKSELLQPKLERYEAAAVALLTHSGRPSSPINLCSSLEAGDAEEADGDYDDAEHEEDVPMPDEVESAEEVEYRRATSSAQSWSPPECANIIIKGGEPTMDPKEMDELLEGGRHSKPWSMAEKGLGVDYIFGLKAPADRYLGAFTTCNPKRPGKFWKELTSVAYKNSRRASAVAVATNKILLSYKDCRYMIEVVGFSYDPNMPVDDALRAIKAALDAARASGAPLTTITNPWEYYVWTRDPVKGWYVVIDRRLHNHPNFQVTGQHRSGHVTPPPQTAPAAQAAPVAQATPVAQTAPTAKGKEKRRREDDDLEIIQHADSPRPKATRPSLPATRASEAASLAGYPLTQRNVPTPLSTSTSTPAPSADATLTTAASADTQAAANILLESRASVAGIQAQLFSFRQAQFELDQQDINARNQFMAKEQAALEEDRIQRAEREAAELEERINFERRSQFFDQCLCVASTANLDPEILDMARQGVRQALESGMDFGKPFVAPRAPSAARMVPRRATSVPVQTYHSSLPKTPLVQTFNSAAPAPLPSSLTLPSGSNAAIFPVPGQLSTPAPRFAPPLQSFASPALRSFASPAPLAPPAPRLAQLPQSLVPSVPASAPLHFAPGSSLNSIPLHGRSITGSAISASPVSSSPLVTSAASHVRNSLPSGLGYPTSPGIGQRWPGQDLNLFSPSCSRHVSGSTTFSPSLATPGTSFSPGTVYSHLVNLANQAGPQSHAVSALPTTPQMHVNVNSQAPDRHSMVGNHTIPELDETFDQDVDDFEHIGNASFLGDMKST
ncbi:hypothetical protein FRC07_005205 [Ceratobasidium sp. 392]|nr:hypothetical protein FRC07_005205 [Ceratobasidium sp. 392]